MLYIKTCPCGKNFETTQRNAEYCVVCGGWRRSCVEHPRKQQKSHFLFKDVIKKNVELMSYLLGYVCSDGTVSLRKGRFDGVRIYSTDYQIIHDMNVALGNPASICSHRRNGVVETWSIGFCGENARYFECTGLRAKKDEQQMENFKGLDEMAFLRGLFEGDGSLDVTTKYPVITFLGRESMIRSVGRCLERVGFPCRLESHMGKNVRMFRVRLGGSRAKRLLGMMYGSEPVSLLRKRELVRVALEER